MRVSALAFALLTTPLAACDTSGGGGSPPEETLAPLTVAHYRLPCASEPRQLCLQVQGEGEGAFHDSSEIEGFDFIWGRQARIVVRTLDSGALMLEDVVSDTLDRDAFELPLTAGDFTVVNATTLRLVDGTEATCATEDLCRIIVARMGQGAAVVRARAGASAGDPLSLFRLM